MPYTVFARNWWKDATRGTWPNGLEPAPGAPREFLAEVETEKEARELCAEYRAENEPGRYSRKAEYEES